MLVSITRLRLRSVRFLLPFAYYAMRSSRQALTATGCLGVQTRKTPAWTFWTLTTWDNSKSLRNFLTRAPHRDAMFKLPIWCDEAAVARWEQASEELPTWQLAAEQLLKLGRLSKVTYPSDAHKHGQINIT